MMTDHRGGRIVRDRMDEPHVQGRRVSVLQIRDRVERGGSDPRTVAERLDLDVADVYRALAYYHDHPREMAEVLDARDRALQAVRAEMERPEGVEPGSE